MSAQSHSSDILSFENVYDIVKNNQTNRFEDVYRTLLRRSDYVSVIPQKEQLAILHYLVLHSAVHLFKRIITIPNIQFNILMKTDERPQRDIVEICSKLQKTPEVKELSTLIHRLVQIDKFLEYGRRDDYNYISGMADQDEDLINEKPPYRRYYLVHHLAYANDRDGFDKLHKKYNFNLTVLTSDRETASEIAFQQGHTDFGNYLESLSPEMRQIRESRQRQTAEIDNQQRQRNKIVEEAIVTTLGADMLPRFVCPLTKEVFTEPVVLDDGYTYERSAIENWLKLGKKTSPMTNIPLANLNLVPNHAIKQIINEMRATKAK